MNIMIVGPPATIPLKAQGKLDKLSHSGNESKCVAAVAIAATLHKVQCNVKVKN